MDSFVGIAEKRKEWRMYKKILYLSIGILVVLISIPQSVFSAHLVNAVGKVSFLRVHAPGTGYGPPTDYLDGEVVIKLKSEPNMAFGFQLRDDPQRPVRRAMLDLIRDAFKNDWTIHIDYWIDTGKKTGIIHRIWITK
jgi:hypothetical protein